jgi:hypothetical protein
MLRFSAIPCANPPVLWDLWISHCKCRPRRVSSFGRCHNLVRTMHPGVAKDFMASSTKYLDLPPAAARDKASFEVLRVWIAEQGQHVSIRSGAWEDPFAWGIVLADLARHIAHAHALQHPATDEDAFVERLLEGFHAEIENPTDEPEGDITQ